MCPASYCRSGLRRKKEADDLTKRRALALAEAMRKEIGDELLTDLISGDGELFEGHRSTFVYKVKLRDTRGGFAHKPATLPWQHGGATHPALRG